MPNASRCLLWLVLAGPVAVQTVRYLTEAIYYGEYLHWTGVQATRLLILTLAVTPLRLLLPRTRWILWLVARRRDLGLATFLYAALHALAYLLRKADAGTILEEAMQAGMLVGWIGLLLLLALAATSNDYSVRALRGRWKNPAPVHLRSGAADIRPLDPDGVRPGQRLSASCGGGCVARGARLAAPGRPARRSLVRIR